MRLFPGLNVVKANTGMGRPLKTLYLLVGAGEGNRTLVSGLSLGLAEIVLQSG